MLLQGLNKRRLWGGGGQHHSVGFRVYEGDVLSNFPSLVQHACLAGRYKTDAPSHHGGCNA